MERREQISKEGLDFGIRIRYAHVILKIFGKIAYLRVDRAFKRYLFGHVLLVLPLGRLCLLIKSELPLTLVTFRHNIPTTIVCIYRWKNGQSYKGSTIVFNNAFVII